MDVPAIEVITKRSALFGQTSFMCQSLATKGDAHRYSISRCSSNEDYCGLQMEIKVPVPWISTSLSIIYPFLFMRAAAVLLILEDDMTSLLWVHTYGSIFSNLKNAGTQFNIACGGRVWGN